MRRFFLIAVFSVFICRAQDKLVLTNGDVVYGKILSVSTKSVFFIYQDSIRSTALARNLILFTETSSGEVRVFGTREGEKKNKIESKSEELPYRNLIGSQPFGLFVGRITLCYERLSKDGQFGIVLPFSLTFDPSALYYTNGDTTAALPTPGTNFIVGVDLNYYLSAAQGNRSFMGPRIRYGTDQLMGGLEGLSIQYQLGWSYWSRSKMVQHLSFGYGFVKILNFPSGSNFNSDQLYGWFSLNYRISFKW